MLLLLIFEGVRQRTVRQQSTMDNSGTMPIFVYGNTSQPEHDPIQQDDHDERQAAIPEHPDDITPTTRLLQYLKGVGLESLKRTLTCCFIDVVIIPSLE